jgi:mono/diheme cytochrome c family protein
MTHSRLSARPVIRQVAVALLLAVPAMSPGQERAPQPFTGASAGGRVFVQKGCGLCHAIRGPGPTVGPELARIERRSFFDIGAAMSNHLRGVSVPKPTLTEDEVTSLVAFLFTLQYHDQPGDPKAGQQAFGAKGCIQCHEVGGTGGRRGPSLDFFKGVTSPVLLAVALWNHGPEMAQAAETRGIPRPTFTGKELGDIVAFIGAAAKPGSGQLATVQPGVPESGQKLFTTRHCVECHSIAGRGGKVGPELGQPARHHLSLTEFAALMWNHGPQMWARMKERGIQVPRLKGQEMADLVAYLYVSHYFDRQASPVRGRQALQDKGCLTCHAAGGQGGRTGSALATHRAARSGSALIAALWNHPRYLPREQREVPWPSLTGPELADIAAFLASLPPSAGAAPR